jgi:hypothetical protein
VRRKVKAAFKLNIFKILSIVVLVLIILFLPLFIQRVIKINKVECLSQFGTCPDYLNLPQNGDYLNLKKILKDSLEKNVLVNGYLIQYKFPDILKLDLILDTPTYAVYDINSKKYYFVGTKDKIVSEGGNSDLAYIKVDNFNLKAGDLISDDISYLAKILKGANYLYGVNFIEVKKSEVIFKLEGKTVRLPTSGDADYLLGSVRLIFSRLNENPQGIRMEDVQEIDLRFKNPILR